MAIYRIGQASMDADGYITGYGTKWKTALTLIRPGATIVFASNPVAYATISEIINDTSLRATASGGAVVPKGDYVILLHDSLTVDGLAQDVAETLRYYQGKETMYEQFVEFLKNFDWERMEQLGEKVYADSKAAEASANAAKASETNANASKNAAAGSATTASQKATEAANSAGAAKTSETNANASKTAAANSATAAAGSATTAGQHKDAAAASASAARTSEGNASSSKNAAAASASAAKTSETNAKASETSATASKNAAKTSEDNAAASKNAAASSASAAAGSATSASNSAATAKSEADRAADLAKQLDATNLMRKDANLSDVTNKAAARENIQVDRLVQGSTSTTVGKSGGNRLAVNDAGDWGALDSSNNWIALGVAKGGTGARDAAGARKNLQVDRFNQDSTTETRVLSADGAQALVTPNGSAWGLYRFGSGWIPLGVGQGGTGAKDAAGARANLGLGSSSTVKFGTIQVDAPAANPLLLKSANPCIKFEETDAPSGGASSYFLVMDGGNIRMQENNTGSGDTVFEYIANTNTMKLPKAEFRDKAGTRNNLELGAGNTVTFSQVRSPNGMICTTESNSANDNPSAPLVMQIRASDKSTILGQAEFRADRNGALSIINRTVPNSPKFFTIQSTGEVNPSGEIVSNSGGTFSYMEVGRKNANTPAYIDFHYGAKYDYDARIICDGMNSDQAGGGNLRFYSGYENHLAKGSYNFQGGRFRVTTSDMVIECPVNISRDLTINSTRWNHDASDTVPQKGSGGSRGIHTGVDSYDFNKASNINLYSWYSIGFCTTFGSPTNGVVSGKPAVLINTRNGDINTKGAVISKGVTLTCDRTQKSDIREIDDEYVLDRMCKVSNYTYRYNEGISYTCGIMAQELEIWMPELVSKNESDNDSLNVNHAGLVGYLHSCIRALKARNDELEGRLRKIESYLAFKFPEDDI